MFSFVALPVGLRPSNELASVWVVMEAPFAAFIMAYAGWEALAGWTPGRRLGGLRLADCSGDRPHRLLLLLRCVIRFAFLAGFALLLGVVLATLASGNVNGLLSPIHVVLLLLGIGPVCGILILFLPAFFLPHRLPLHDVLTGITWCVRQRDSAEPHRGDMAEVIAIQPAHLERRPHVAAPRPTSRMDQYELGELLGQGGMGAVYAAHDTTLGRRVAIKVLSGSLADSPVLSRRFEREARLAAQLAHPNVARASMASATPTASHTW